MSTTNVELDLSSRQDREDFKEYLRSMLGESILAWDAPQDQIRDLSFDDYFEPYIRGGVLHENAACAPAHEYLEVSDQARRLYREVRDELLDNYSDRPTVFAAYKNQVVESDTPGAEGTTISPVPSPKDGGLETWRISKYSEELGHKVFVIAPTVDILYDSTTGSVAFRDPGAYSYMRPNWDQLKKSGAIELRERKESDNPTDLLSWIEE